MKLTIENWSYSNIKAEIKDFSHVDKVKLAVFCAEKVIGIFESKYPGGKRPRLAIEAAKEFIKNPTDENKQKCKDAAYDAAAYAAAGYAAYDAAAYAAAGYADAAAYAAASSDKIKQEIIDYISSIKDRDNITFSENEKPVYTQEMADNGELPPVGSEILLACKYDSKPSNNNGVVLFSSVDNCVMHNGNGECCYKMSDYTYCAIDTRTDEEKLIETVTLKFNDWFNGSTKLSVGEFMVKEFEITLK